MLSAAPRWQTYRLTRVQAAEIRAAWRLEVERLRAAGELLDTRDVLAAWGLGEELRARGWDHDEWPELPEEAVEQGRWPGSRDTGTPGRIPVRLPAELVHRARAGCWFASADAIGTLRQWRDENPGIVSRQLLYGTPTGALAEYEELARQVITTGVVWRAAIDRGLARARSLPSLPTPPPPAGR